LLLPGSFRLFEDDGFPILAGAETLTPVDPNVDPEPVPEPATILGSVTALGMGRLLKKKSAKKNQKDKTKS
jgi:Ni,Fe-hydrogenase III small subunit